MFNNKFTYILLLISLLANHCRNKNSKDSLAAIAGSTNAGNQEYILLSHEFEKENYPRIIEFVDNYFDKNKLNKNNLKVLLLSVQAREKLVKKINTSIISSRKDLAKKYGFQYKNNKALYNYKELKTIWQKFPNTTYGKEAFIRYIENLNDQKEKVNSYEQFVDNIKDKKFRNRIRFELSNLYLKDLIDLKGKKAKKLSDLFDKLLKTEYYDKVIANAFILKYNISGNFNYYSREIEKLLNKNNINGMIANYLNGDLLFAEDDLKKAKNYYKTAKKKTKYIKGKNEIPFIFLKLGHISDATSRGIKSAIDKKIMVIDKLEKYRKIFQNKKIAVIAGERVRLRKDPSLSSKNIITTLNYGTKVSILSQGDCMENIESENNYWYRVQLADNTIGWVFGKYLSFFIF